MNTVIYYLEFVNKERKYTSFVFIFFISAKINRWQNICKQVIKLTIQPNYQMTEKSVKL